VNPIVGHAEMTRSLIDRVLRVALVLPPTALLIQAVTAGLLLSVPGGRTAHSVSTFLVLAAEVALLIVAIVARRRGHPSRRLVVGAAVLLTLTIAQAGAGFAGLTALHVPLGALLLAVTAMQLTAARQAG
jgi:hypothetical protein